LYQTTLRNVAEDSIAGRCKAIADGAPRFIFAVGPEISNTGAEMNVQDKCKFRVQTQTHVCQHLCAVQLRQLACHACIVEAYTCTLWTDLPMYLKLLCSEWRLPSMFVQTARSWWLQWLCMAVCRLLYQFLELS